MILSKKNETLECVICKKRYNLEKRKPYALIPCGHTFCLGCIQNLYHNNCPTCKNFYNQSIPDYEIIDILKNPKNETIVNTNRSQISMLKPEIIHLIKEGTKEQQLIGVTALRKLLSAETNPPIQEIIEAQLVPKLVELLDSNNATIQYEAAWALTNIASGDSNQTANVIDAGAVPKFVKLINSLNEDTIETAIWALGNIAGDGPKCRDIVIDNGALNPIVKVLSTDCRRSVKHNGIWALSNFCRNKKSSVEFNKLECILPILANYIQSDDIEILSDVCWAVSYLTDGPNDQIEKILFTFNLKRFAELLKHTSNKVLIPALRIVGNIVTGSDEQTQKMLDCKILPTLFSLLNSPKESIRKEVCWAISNITAGDENQIQQVIDTNIFPKLIQILNIDTFNVKKEAAWAVANAINGGSESQIKYIIDLEVIEIFCSLLNTDAKIILISLESLFNIFKYYEKQKMKENPYKAIKKCNGFEKIEELLNSSNKSITENALKIIDRYLVMNED